MAEGSEVQTTSSTELLASGRRHLAVKDYSAAVELLANACEVLAKEHGELGDQCAEAYLWYGKSLLGLSRQESEVLGDRVPGQDDNEENDDDEEENGEGGEEEQNGTADSEKADVKENGDTEKSEPESTTAVEVPSSSNVEAGPSDEPGASNGEGHDESVVNLDNEDDVDNLQLAWEMLDLARSILLKRVQDGGADVARALLADVHFSLGEVALESETYDKAVLDLQNCLELQKELYQSDDRRIAETHYQIGLANSLASNFDDAVTHFKNAANILETRIKVLENPSAGSEDATVKKHATSGSFASAEDEIKDLKELLPEIQEKIQDMMDYKSETKRRVLEALSGTNGESSQSNGAANNFSSGSSSAPSKPATNISHLIKRKRKSSESEETSAAKKANT